MNHRLQTPGIDVIRAAYRTQLQAAAACLADPDCRLTNSRVHNARKSLKRARAILKLMRDLLSRPQYRYQLERIREVAQSLAGIRDAYVLHQTLDQALSKSSSIATQRVIGMLRRQLSSDLAAVHAHVLNPQALAVLMAQLNDAAICSSRWRLRNGDDPKIIAAALRRSYKRGRKALRAVQKTRSSLQFHEWRKQVKCLKSQLDVCGCQPDFSRELGELGDVLGQARDLILLHEKLTAGKAAPLKRVVKDVERRYGRLLQRALRSGKEVYRCRPRRFAARLEHGDGLTMAPAASRSVGRAVRGLLHAAA